MVVLYHLITGGASHQCHLEVAGCNRNSYADVRDSDDSQ